jgi:ABC-type nitrate/sulfonate/bicarbonate transport system substrate-binding protein
MDHGYRGASTTRKRRLPAEWSAFRNHPVWRRLAALLALALLAAACASGAANDAADDTTDRQQPENSGAEIIRFAFAPDPVWDYLKDTGTLAAWESEHNVRVVDTSTWDEFTYFAGGHGDIISTASYELPLLERETKTKTVTFGKYNHVRNVPLTRSDSGYETFADLPDGAKVAASSAVGATVVWGMLVEKLHGRTLASGTGDFELVVADNALMAELVRNGEVEVCICDPETAARPLRTGELTVMYEGRTPQDLYREITGHDHFGLMSNMFTATEAWYEKNPDLAVAFAELWQQGLNLWNSNLEEIVSIYPQHFAVESEEDVQFVTDYLKEKDWFVDEVALTREWIEGETQMYELMKETGFMEQTEQIPRFEVLDVQS